MIQHRFALALAAVALSVGLIDVADAYPTTARSGSTSVTGAYRPLNLSLTLQESGTLGLTYNGDNELVFQGRYTGTYTGSGTGYAAGIEGSAGFWLLELGTEFGGHISLNVEGTTIAMNSDLAGQAVGHLTYQSGFQAVEGLPGFDTLGIDDDVDTPRAGDRFVLFAPSAGLVLRAIVGDLEEGISFELDLLQDLVHLGPYNSEYCDFFGCDVAGLNLSRVNTECSFNATVVPCGTIAARDFSASSAPEPTTLALFGLGLAGLGWRRRAR